MRLRRRETAAPTYVRPPEHLVHPGDGMTPAELTAELDAWAVTLAKHEHPPAAIERMRLFQADGLVPLDWAALEAADAEVRAAHLARVIAEGGPLVGPEGMLR